MSPLIVAAHPLLEVVAFVTAFPSPLGKLPASDTIRELLSPGAKGPFAVDDAVRGAVRDLLRHGGYKPTGRGKPSSEYLLRALAEGALGSINLAVDAGNAVSLHSGLPVSVVDLERTTAPLRIEVAAAGARYVFNAAGQEIDLAGLLCLFDGDGPCANAVKDAQRTKTTQETARTISIVWGTRTLPGRAAETASWYRALLERADAATEPVSVTSGG
jgi:DNA/RNA-binding domain of Phe-tRNA-synthetase-like protein